MCFLKTVIKVPLLVQWTLLLFLSQGAEGICLNSINEKADDHHLKCDTLTG